MTTLELIEILKGPGGYGLSVFMYWLLRQEKSERIRYRDFHEETIKELPKLTIALQELKDAVEKIRR